MKQQITRLSPHQNAKVFAVMMAITSLVFIAPFMLIASLASPKGAASLPLAFFIFFPIAYLVMGYIMTAVGCTAYNLVTKYTGGIEFESEGA